MNFFSGLGKVREIGRWLGEFRKNLKVREKSGNLKIHGYGRQSSENLLIKMIFVFIRGYGKLKCQGNIREKSGNFEVDDKWQPYTCICNVESSVLFGQWSTQLFLVTHS